LDTSCRNELSNENQVVKVDETKGYLEFNSFLSICERWISKIFDKVVEVDIYDDAVKR